MATPVPLHKHMEHLSQIPSLCMADPELVSKSLFSLTQKIRGDFAAYLQICIHILSLFRTCAGINNLSKRDWALRWITRISRVRIINATRVYGRDIKPPASQLNPVPNYKGLREIFTGADHPTSANRGRCTKPCRNMRCWPLLKTGHWTKWTLGVIQSSNPYVPIYTRGTRAHSHTHCIKFSSQSASRGLFLHSLAAGVIISTDADLPCNLSGGFSAALYCCK